VQSQLELLFGNTWGGKRPGAGRKSRDERAGVSHLRRAAHSRHHPLHVTVRVRGGLPSLRSESLYRCILAQIHAAKQRFLRIVHFSVQSNHIHLIVEADDRRRLGQGMKGFAVRVARRVNGELGSRGSVFGDRYHARALKTPRDVRNVLIYVLLNRKKHGSGEAGADPCSSAKFFDGWSERASFAKARGSPEAWPVAPGDTWLLRSGWKRGGKLDLADSPKSK
jgi:REP element-mobilizing transposase RayT